MAFNAALENTKMKYNPETVANINALTKNGKSVGEAVGEISVTEIKGIFDKNVGTKENPATQQEINTYIDYAVEFSRQRKELGNDDFPKQRDSIIGNKVTERLVSDLQKEYGIDISNRYHAYNDNDLRHIINSHGEKTNEKYPITAEDLKQIPDIVENYDDVLYVPTTDGKQGIYYVKRHNGVTYYLESLVSDGLLSNKQMIKTDTGTIPDIKGLKDAINKKWNSSSLQMKNIPRMYVQDVKETVHDNSISNENEQNTGEIVNNDGEARKRLLPSEMLTRITGENEKASAEAIESAVNLSNALDIRILFYRGEPGENGYFANGAIHLNVLSKRPTSWTVAHELTHFIENTEAYKYVHDMVFEKLRVNGENIEAKIKAKQATYKTHGETLSRTGAQQEIVADFIAENLLTDNKTIKQLVSKNRSFGQRVLDFCDRAISKLTGRSTERAFFTNLRARYAQALNEAVANTEAVSEIKKESTGQSLTDAVKNDTYLDELLSKRERGEITEQEYNEAFDKYIEDNPYLDELISDDMGQALLDGGERQYSFEDGKITLNDIAELRSIGRKNVNDFTSEDMKKAEPFARRAWKELGMKSPFFRAWFGDWRANDNNEVNIVTSKSDTRGLHKNIDTGWGINRSAKLNFERHNSVASITGRQFIPYIDGIIENSILLDSQISDNDNENSLMFHSLYAVIKDGNQKGVIKLIVEELKNPGKDIERRAYKLVDIEKLSTRGGKGSLSLTYSLSVDSIHSIADLFEFVKTYDKEFKPNPVSAVVDKDGKPLRMYHGTNVDEDFTVFDGYGGNFGLFGIGSYFTDNKSVAQSYTKKGKGNNPRVYEVYLNIKNPLDMDAKADKQKWIEAVDEQDRADFDRYIEKASTNEDAFKALKELCADNQMYREEAYEYITSVIQKMGYDGITHIGGGRYGVDDGTRHRVYITFEPEQVKSATDNIGTFDKKNPDIKYSFEDVDKDNHKAYNGNIDNTTKEGALNEVEHQRGTLQTEILHSGRVYGDSENLGNKRRRNSGDNGNISVGNPEVESHTSFEKKIEQEQIPMTEIKQTVWNIWDGLYVPQQQHKLKVGPRPTGKDILKL